MSSNILQKFIELELITSEINKSNVQKLILLVHSVNLTNKLNCYVQDSQYVLPPKWNQNLQGIYSLEYLNPQKKKIQFKFVDTNDNFLNINFVQEGTEKLYSIKLDTNQQKSKNITKYENYLKQSLFPIKKAEQKSSIFSKRLIPVPLNQPQRRDNPNLIRPPLILPNTNNQNNTGGLFNPNNQYVGPNSEIFRPQRPNQFQPNFNIPFGARYDPIDPFDEGNQGNINNSNFGNTFMGFDEFGRPITMPKNNRGGFGFNNGNRFI